MSIRSAAKAIIVHEGKVLLNLCDQPGLGRYYTLPGGGQNQYETMEEAVVRECLEETGYTVIPEAAVALLEEIYLNPDFRKQYPDYSHKIFHVFRCRLESTVQRTPSETDTFELGCEWITFEDIPSIRLYPARIHEHFHELLQADVPLYLGSASVTF